MHVFSLHTEFIHFRLIDNSQHAQLCIHMGKPWNIAEITDVVHETEQRDSIWIFHSPERTKEQKNM